MDGLLKEIRCKDEAAVSVLEQAGLRADSDLQLLTLHDLGELFPGVENVKLRRKIFDIIQTQKPIDVLIKEFKDFIPHESLRTALTENRLLVDYLKMLKEMKTQMNNDFLDRHISLLEDFRKSQPSQDQDKGEIMDGLLKEIRREDEAAASVLEHAGLRADSDLRSLTLQELGELFPGVKNVKLRRKIFDIIQTQKPIDVLIKEFKDFIPHEYLRAALTENRVLVDYLKMLKEMKTKMNKVQDFLDAHINLLEDFRKSQPSQDQYKGEIMDILLKEIRCKDGKALSVLEEAGLSSDSDVQSLTLQDLGELFPGVKNVKLRRTIFDVVHKQKPMDVLIKEFKDFIPHESLRAALTEHGVLVSYLKVLKEMKTQMNEVQDFLDAHINLLKDFSKSQPSQDKGENMDVLLTEIRLKDGKAASVLGEADLRSDSDLQLLTLQDLGLLFPGVKNIKLRIEIFAIIQTQKQIDVPIEEFKDFIPHESLRAALTEHGVLVNYLKMLKEMKSQMNKVQDFLGAHINLLEDFRKSQPSQDQDKDCSSRSRSLSMRSIISTHVQPQKRQVTYKMVISGITFDADKQLLHRVMTSSGDRILKLLSQEDGDVIIVFCPVVSRTGTDVEAAMAQVTGDKPVILVVMHHTYGARSVPSVKTWKDSCKVVLCVHVFYHEKVPGLLPCQENNDAIFKIRTELLKYGVDITESTSGDTQNRFIPKFFSKYIK